MQTTNQQTSIKHEAWAGCVSRGEAIPEYEVSDLGRVRRAIPGHGTYEGRILGVKIDSGGYPRMILMHDGKKLGRRVHHLVAEAFIGPRPEGYVINHIDGVKANNHVANLEYCTARENLRHAVETGLLNLRVQRTARKRLPLEQVIEIKSLTGAERPSALARRMGCTVDTVNDIQKGVTHKNLILA